MECGSADLEDQPRNSFLGVDIVHPGWPLVAAWDRWRSGFCGQGTLTMDRQWGHSACWSSWIGPPEGADITSRRGFMPVGGRVSRYAVCEQRPAAKRPRLHGAR